MGAGDDVGGSALLEALESFQRCDVSEILRPSSCPLILKEVIQTNDVTSHFRGEVGLHSSRIMKRASAASNARSGSRKSGVIGLIRMGQRVHLQAKRPNESGTLVNRDAIPVQRVRVGLRFAFAATKHPDLGLGSGRFPEIGVGRHAREE
jgi:hypothetical protein